MVVYRASQQVPSFYTQALAAQPHLQSAAGDELERNVLQLQNQTQQTGRWQVRFTEQQVNGWLAADLPEKFPGLLPKEVHDPRVAIREDELLVACRYESKKFSAIVSLALDVYLTEEPNWVAVRLRSVQAGVLPLPLNKFMDRIARTASQAGLVLRWAQTEGDPVALIQIPDRHRQHDQHLLLLDVLMLEEEQFLVAGSTCEAPEVDLADVDPSAAESQVDSGETPPVDAQAQHESESAGFQPTVQR